MSEKSGGKYRLQQALNHKEGPVPIDFGSTAITGIHCSIVEKLRDVYGLEKRVVKVHEPYQMLGYIEDDLIEAMDIDVVGIIGRGTMFGFPNERLDSNEGWKEWKTPWNQVVLVPKEFQVSEQDGDVFIYPKGDRTVSPSGHMPSNGYFFDSTNRQEESVDEENLNVEDNLEEFTYITDIELKHFEREAKRAKATGKGVVGNFGGTAFGDIAFVPGPGLLHPKGIRDVAEWYMATVAYPDYVHAIFEKQAEIALSNLEKIYGVVGNVCDAVVICGTDFGTQTGQFCSVETFNSLYAPYYKKVNDWIHKNTTWQTFKHSCGAVEPLIDSFIEAGFDILNPVQVSATGMGAEHLKSTYGDRLTFWGGGVDTQQTLPFGSADEVRKEVQNRLEIFSENGGYVFNVIHNLQAATPIENVEAMLETVSKFNEKRK